jgi:UDP-N-acetylglucosamine diphosphorylase/glucosamine-1-phosphate N-acetyltransferase
VPVYLYDDPADLPRFQPFSTSRPLGELRYGAWLLRERVERHWGPVEAHLTSPHLLGFVEPGAVPAMARPANTQPQLFLRSTFVVEASGEIGKMASSAPAPGLRLTDRSGATVGAVLAPETPWRGPGGIVESWPAQAMAGKLLTGVWELVGDLPAALRADLEAVRSAHGPGTIPAGCTVLGDPGMVILEGALVEPLVVFDARNGPIWLGPGVEVRSFTRLAGPLAVHAGTRLVGGQIRESSIGPRCVVHGEVSNCIFLGYANKAHDGFLGHSVVGRWVNIGAGTVTSNLKNTYGPVRLDLGGERVETGLQFLGSLVGDHAKTAIGTMLPTGCVIGAGANVFGTRRPPAHLPPFAWGTDEPGRLMACRMFLQVAARVMPRRDVACDDATRAYLTAVWEAATGQRCA